MRGLNTEVTRSLTSTAMVLVELVEDQHDRDEHAAVYPGSRPSRGGKATTSCLSVLICLWRLQGCYKEEREDGLRLPCAYVGVDVTLPIPCYGGGDPPFIGAAGAREACPSPPQLGSSWTWSMIVETTVGAEKPPPTRTASLLPQELVGGPTVDVSLARSASFPSITKGESLVVRLAGTATLCPL